MGGVGCLGMFVWFISRTFSVNEQYFYLIINQSILLSAMAYQPSEQDIKCVGHLRHMVVDRYCSVRWLVDLVLLRAQPQLRSCYYVLGLRVWQRLWRVKRAGYSSHVVRSGIP